MRARTHMTVRTPKTAQVHSHVRAVPASHAIYIHLVASSRPRGSICASERPQGTPRHPSRGAPYLPLDPRPGTYPQWADWLQLGLYGPRGSWHQISWSQGQVPCIEVLSSLGATDAQIGTPRPFESSAHSFWSQTPAQTKGLFGKESNVDPLPSGGRELKPRGFWDP